MTKTRFTPEQIISKLREAEVAQAAMFGSWVIIRDHILSGLTWSFYNRTLRLPTCRENKGSGIFLNVGGLRSLIKNYL